jgi:hypothetical protein
VHLGFLVSRVWHFRYVPRRKVSARILSLGGSPVLAPVFRWPRCRENLQGRRGVGVGGPSAPSSPGRSSRARVTARRGDKVLILTFFTIKGRPSAMKARCSIWSTGDPASTRSGGLDLGA